MGETQKGGIQQKVAEAKSRIENLSPQQVAEERDKGALVVDVRESEERARDGVIPGAIHVPRGLLEWMADPSSSYHRQELDPGRRVILHCAGGGRSALAVETLQELGYTDVAHLDGGFGAWKQAELPVDKPEA